MTVYIIVAIDPEACDGTSIEFVVTNKEVAKEIVRRYDEVKYPVECIECKLDDYNPKALKFKCICDIELDRNLNVVNVYKHSIADFWGNETTISGNIVTNYFVRSVFADSEEAAIQIARDKLADYIATRRGTQRR